MFGSHPLKQMLMVLSQRPILCAFDKKGVPWKLKKKNLSPLAVEVVSSYYYPVLDAIEKANYIFIGPGDLFTSIIPNLIVPGVRQALQNTSAKIYFFINVMTKFGETHNFSGKDFVVKLENCLRCKIDGFIGNNTKPLQEVLDIYSEQKSDFVDIDMADPFWDHRNLLLMDVLDTNAKIARHDPKKLAGIISKIIFE